MVKRLLAFTAAICFAMVPIHNALAHGGGLNESGCHNETATGGYHCHKDDDNETLKVVGVAAGGLLVGGIVWAWINSRGNNPSVLQRDGTPHGKGIGFTPYLKGDESVGLGVHYDLNRFSRLGMHVMYDRNDGQDEAGVNIGAVWNLRF